MTDSPSASADELLLLDFWGDWCGVCRLIDPVVKRVVHEQGVQLRKVNVAEEPEIAKKHQIAGLPTLVLLAKDGRELNRLSGSMTGKQIAAAITSARAKASVED